jgi:head-tail adaptor
MNAGNLNRRILLQTLTSANDGAGGTTNGVWADGDWCFAEVIPVTASRRLNYNQIITEGWSHLITTYFMGVSLQPNVRMRAVLDDGTIMLIHSVINIDYKNHLIELAAYADPMAEKYELPVKMFVVDEQGNQIIDEQGNEIIL